MITGRIRRTRRAATAGVLGSLLTVTVLAGTGHAATGDSDASGGNDGRTRGEAQAVPTRPATEEESRARIRITPGDGARQVGISDPVKVTVSDGRLTRVTMTAVASGTEIAGTLSADGTSWTPDSPLQRATRYQIAAEGEDAEGRFAAANATITTTSPANEFLGHLFPEDGSTVGVGMPVRFDFNSSITDKAAVQSQIKVSSSSGQKVVGHWFDDHRLDFRPESYWKAGSTVTVEMTVGGVRQTATFTIGRSQISTVDAKTKKMTVVRDGKKLKTIPISSGSAEHPTYNGQMVISEKYGHIRMNGASVGLTEKDGKPAYDIAAVPHAMRLTDSGTFIHGNYWGAPSVFGKVNTSHGCVGLQDVRGGDDSTRPAAWFFDNSMIGDVVIVKNSQDKTALAPANGLSDWNMPWSQWVAGSATD